MPKGIRLNGIKQIDFHHCKPPHLEAHDGKNNDGCKDGCCTISESHDKSVPVIVFIGINLIFHFLIELFVRELSG